MCGITGFVDFSKKSTKKDIENMTCSLSHRGPDSSDHYFEETDLFSLGMGHQRLSIIDISQNGNQPMFFENLIIVYNGEIYNFKEIRTELIKYGYTFKTDSDTEVVIKSFHKWGYFCVNKFNGMFAFAIYNQYTKKLFLFRDRMGVKPLYYYYKNNIFLFGSELKTFHKIKNFTKKINIESLDMFFRFGYIMQPFTIFDNAFKLEAGYYIEFDLNSKKLTKNKYWDIYSLYKPDKNILDFSYYYRQLEEILISAFKYRTVSDVPLGVFLSGGIDSSLVASILARHSDSRLNTFTIAFEESEFNEGEYSKKIADHLGCKHKEFVCTQKDALSLLDKIPEYFDEPFGDSSSIPTMLLSKNTSAHVKVALSGDGGDELFFGYNKYFRILNLKKKLDYIPVFLNKSFIFSENNIKDNKLRRNYYLLKNSIKYRKNSSKLLEYRSSRFTCDELNKILIQSYKRAESNFDLYNRTIPFNLNMQLTDMSTYLIDDILVKTDRASMAYSLETREPMLDHRIIEFAVNLPDKYKYNSCGGKFILKEILKKYIPEDLFNRPKMGFGIPVSKWMRNDLKEKLDYYLSHENIKKSSILDFNEVDIIKKNFYSGNNTEFEKLWFILMFQTWHEKWG
jgi:asparagine synthase (glutamine-hydrolysing)